MTAKRELERIYSLLDRTHSAVEKLQSEGFDRKFDLSSIKSLQTKIQVEIEAREAWKLERLAIKEAKLERKRAREARKLLGR